MKITDQYLITTLKEHQIDDLLELQRSNLKENLDSETIDSQGFVSFRYTPEIIKLKMADAPQVIAESNGEVIGYALTTTLKVAASIGSFDPMIKLLKTLSFKNKPMLDWRYYIIGQVCVKEGWRGKGVFDALYEGHKKYMGNDYDLAITEIASDNRRSIAAHRRVGFITFHTFFDEFNQKEWQVVGLEVAK